MRYYSDSGTIGTPQPGAKRTGLFSSPHLEGPRKSQQVEETSSESPAQEEAPRVAPVNAFPLLEKEDAQEAPTGCHFGPPPSTI